jgi:D-alanine-D-alanine ligase
MPNLKTKKKIALVAGGDSGEKVISIGSAAVIKKNLDPKRYEVYTIHISKAAWEYVPEKGKPVPVDKNDFSIKVGSKKIHFDAVFIAIHGTPGEDGRLQAYFDLLDIPYSTCGQMTSSPVSYTHLTLPTN